MSPTSEEWPPAATTDPAILRLVREEYAHADRLRATLLGRFFGVVGGLILLRLALGLTGVVPLRTYPWNGLLVALVTALGLGSLQVILREQTGQAGRRRNVLWYGSTLIEIGWVTSAWLVFDRLAPVVDSRFPGTVSFAAFIILSALRLDWKITVFTGVIAGLANAVLYLSLDPGPWNLDRPGWASGFVLLVTMGSLVALVAEQARRRTFHAVAAVVSRQRLEREVMDRADAERRRIGQDLHDGLGGRLSGTTLMAETLARRAEAGEAVRAEQLRDLAALLREGVDEARRLARGLDPAPVELGLTHALEGLADRTRAAGVPCSFVFEGEEIRLDPSVTLHLYQIAQEAVANALRHADPSQIDIRLTVRSGTVALDVRDDGRGIPETPAEGLGMRTLSKRAELMDAVLKIRPGPKGGTVVSCLVRRNLMEGRGAG